MLQIDAEYVSKDGSLRLLVGHDPDGDIAIGFGGFQWHTHGDILASPSGLPVDQAVERYVGDILSNRALIAIARVGEGIQDIWVTDDPASCFELKSTNERLEFRTLGRDRCRYRKKQREQLNPIGRFEKSFRPVGDRLHRFSRAQAHLEGFRNPGLCLPTSNL